MSRCSRRSVAVRSVLDAAASGFTFLRSISLPNKALVLTAQTLSRLDPRSVAAPAAQLGRWGVTGSGIGMLFLTRASRRVIWSLGVFLVLGPPIGAIAELLFGFMTSTGDAPVVADLAREFAAMLPLGYLIGSVPALLAGALYLALVHFLPELLQRWSYRALLGGAAAAVTSYLIVALFVGVAIATALRAGFSAGVVCALLIQGGHDAQQSAARDVRNARA